MASFTPPSRVFDPTFRDLVRDANPIADLINADLIAAGHPPLSGHGDELDGWHPVHGSQSGASLKVNVVKQVYTCFNCGEGGDVFTWMMQAQHCSFVEALHTLATRAGIPLPHLDPAQQQQWQQAQQDRHDLEDLFRATAAFFHSQLTQEHRDFCVEQWGLTAETIERYQLGFAPAAPGALQWALASHHFAVDAIRKSGLVIQVGSHWHDFFQGRLIFPYWRDLPAPQAQQPGTPLYFIGRRIEGVTPDQEWEKAKYRKQLVHSAKHSYVSPAVTNAYFYGEHVLRGIKDTPLLVTEGVADCLAALQGDLPTISPVTVRFSKASYPRLLQLAQKAKHILICNDSEANAAGSKGALATAAFLDAEGIDVRLVTLPRPPDVDKIDLAEYLRTQTVGEFQALCAQAPTYLEAQLETYAVSPDAFTNCLTARKFVTDVLSQCSDTQRALAFLRYRVKTYFTLHTRDLKDLESYYAPGQGQPSGASALPPATPPAQAGTPTGATPPPQAASVQWGTPGQQPRPKILLSTEMTRIIDETQAALLALPEAPVIYQRARHLAVIARSVKAPKWLHRPHDMPVILDASAARLTELANQSAQYWKLDKRSHKWELAIPPPWVIETLHSRTEWPFPVLEGIISSPTLRPDGSLLDVPGYDATTGLYLDTNGTAFPAIPVRPTLDDARSAIGHLQEAVQNFPWASPWHFSATLAAILSLVCRFAVQGNVPLFAIRATTRASGKSLLADVISLIGTGRAAPRWPQVTEDEEERKRLLTVALAGYPCLHIDNVVRPLGSPALDMALTAPSFSDRILGKHESREAPLSMVWIASGNNMQFQGDTARRIVPIDLDPKMERPEERTDFTHTPLTPWVHQERPRLTMAALLIVKAYFEAGCPPQALTAMGSFEQWSDLIRQALVWAGEADPNEGRKDLEAESNPEYEQLAQLLQAWEVCYPIPQGKARSEARTLKEVLNDIAALKAMDKPPVIPGKPNTPNDYDALQEALGALDRRYDGKGLHSESIGYKLRAMQGRMIGTRRLMIMGKDRTRATLWGVEAL